MKLYEAQVISNNDYGETGHLTVICNDIGEAPITVSYTSPYGAMINRGEKGGFFAIPDPGEKVLITQAENSSRWYFLSVIHEAAGQQTDNQIVEDKNVKPVPKSLYALRRGKPQQVILRDQKGNQLKLSSAYNKNFNIKAELKSQGGKKLLLSDSPKADHISLKTEKGDGLKITSKECGASPPRSVELESKGPVKLFSRESTIDMQVIDGREVNIRNSSTGFNSDAGTNYGNINVESIWKDLNFTVHSSEGKIMIRAKGADGLIQLNSDGDIIIKAPSDRIYLQADNIDIKADSNLKLEAGQNIDIKAGNICNVSGRIGSVFLAEDAAIGGVLLHVQPSTGVPIAGAADSPDDVTNEYGD